MNALPSNRLVETTTRHDVRGQGIAVYDNGARTRLRIFMWVVLTFLGLYGVWSGSSDVVAGSPAFGLAQALAGVTVSAYSVAAAILDVRRLRMPIRLVISRDGFARMPGSHIVSWDEVESIGDPRSPFGQPRTLRIQLADPDEFAKQHRLPLIAHLKLRFDRGDLLMGSGFSIPIPEAEDLMRKAKAEHGARASGRPVRSERPKAHGLRR